MAFSAVFPRVMRPAFGPGLAAATAPSGWWLSGGITAANCLAAYTPKGAASLAASYDNNAAPGNGLADGTYDAAPGVAPTWAAGTGWTFDGSSQYLLFGSLSVTQAYTVLIQYTVGTATGTRYICGTRGPAGIVLVSPRESTARSCYNFGFGTVAGGALTGTHNQGFAGKTMYLDGVSDGAIGAGTGTITNNYAIGCWLNTSTPSNYFSGNVAAFALYNTTLTAPQVWAVSTAMAAF